MKQCFGYIRVSTPKQGKGVSLDAQKDAILAFSAKNGIFIVQWFVEKETAAKRGRPVFDVMLRALKQGKADGVVIHKIDRSARNIADWAKIGELSDAGIDVHFVAEGLDIRTRGGRLSADLQAVIAADFIRNLREETLKGIRGRLKQGLYPFNAPLGYLDNGGGKPKTIDEERRHRIVSMFELYASGQYSIRSLQAEITRRGLRTKSGRPLSKHAVETMLSNPFYCGLMRVRTTGETFKGVHQSIISVRLFDQVQLVKTGKAGKKVTRHNHLFRGLFRCKLCNAAMTPELQKGHVYYRCHTRDCATKCINERIIDHSIRCQLRRFHIAKERFEKLRTDIGAWIEKRSSSNTEQRHALRIGKINERLDRITDAYIDGLIDADTFASRKEHLLLERQRVEEEQDKQVEPDHVLKFLELIKSLDLLYISSVPDEKRELIEWATSNRFVAEKSVAVEPSNLLIDVERALAGACCDPHRTTSRTIEPSTGAVVTKLTEIIRKMSSSKFGQMQKFFSGNPKSVLDFVDI